MSEHLKRKIRLVNGARKRFKDCVNKGESKENCFEKAINWLRGTAKFQGIEISDDEVRNLKMKWLEEE